MKRIVYFLAVVCLSCQRPATTAPAGPSTPSNPAPKAVESAPASPKVAAQDFGRERMRLVSEKDEIISILENGMVVIAKRVSSPALSARAYVKTGEMCEGKWLGGGLSHLLEHLVAGGSNARHSEQENRDLLQSIGNESNAYTTADHTAYFINTTPEHMETAVDLVANWVLGAKITLEEYAREYQVVQRELEMGKGEPDKIFYEMAAANRYQVHPIRVPVIGYQEVIRGLSRDDVYAYYKLAYQPNNMVFSVAGDIEPAKMLAAVQKQVSPAAPGREFPHDLPEEPAVTGPRTMVGTASGLGQAKVSLQFPSIRLDSPDLYALDLLATILADGQSSILVREIRDKQQLVSAISAWDYTPHFVPGSFDIRMDLDPSKLAAATKAVMQEVAQVRTKPPTPEQLDSAKARMKAARLRSMQTSEQIAASLATDYMSAGDAHFSDRYVERVARVTAEQVREVAAKYLDEQKLLTTVLMPAEAEGSAGLAKAEDLVRPALPTTRVSEAPKDSKVTRLELGNGVLLLHKRIATTPLVSIQMFAAGGVSIEDAATNGLGNLAMQLAPRGTTKHTAAEIAKYFDSVGAELSTTCGTNSFQWSASCLKEHFPRTMEYFGEVVNQPTFARSEVEAMKVRVKAAIDEQDADWLDQALRFFRKSYYGPLNSAYQFTPPGTAENLAKFTDQQIRDYYKSRILTARRVLAIYGDIELDQARAMAGVYVGSADKTEASIAPAKAPVRQPAAAGKAAIEIVRVDVQESKHPLAGVVIAFGSDSRIGDPANAVLDVADAMCSGWSYPTGYLHETLRGRGLVYVVHAYNNPGRSEILPGAFVIYAGCEPAKINEVVELIVENIARFQGSAEDMNVSWFERSKKSMLASEALSHETASAQGMTAALDELWGLGFDYHSTFAGRVKGVDIDMVRTAARQRLRSCVVTISTPEPKTVKISKGMKPFDSFPPIDLTPRGVQHPDGAGG